MQNASKGTTWVSRGLWTAWKPSPRNVRILMSIGFYGVPSNLIEPPWFGPECGGHWLFLKNFDIALVLKNYSKPPCDIQQRQHHKSRRRQNLAGFARHQITMKDAKIFSGSKSGMNEIWRRPKKKLAEYSSQDSDRGWLRNEEKITPTK